jgi:hypothetical protein
VACNEQEDPPLGLVIVLTLDVRHRSAPFLTNRDSSLPPNDLMQATGLRHQSCIPPPPVGTAHFRRLFSTSSAREVSALIAVANSLGALLSPTQETVCFLSPRMTVRPLW